MLLVLFIARFSTTWPLPLCANELEPYRQRIETIGVVLILIVILALGSRVILVGAREAQAAGWVVSRTSDNTGAAQVVGPSPVQMLPRAKPASHFSYSNHNHYYYH